MAFKQDFPEELLKRHLESTLGFGLASLTRLPGYANSLNFKAVRASDGLVFAVKCSDPADAERRKRLVTHLDELRGTKAVRRFFPEVNSDFKGLSLLFLSWCPGERVFADRLSKGEMDAFLDDYLDFSAALQRTSDHRPAEDPAVRYRWVLPQLEGTGVRGVRRFLEEQWRRGNIAYRPEKLRIIHDDFHHGNFLFVGHRVAGYFDFEEFRPGYPAEDLVRYVTVCAEHLHFYELYRIRGLLAAFREMVRHMPYSREEWHVAVNAMLLYRIEKYVRRGLGFRQVIRLRLRFRFYRAMSSIVDDGAGLV